MEDATNTGGLLEGRRAQRSPLRRRARRAGHVAAVTGAVAAVSVTAVGTQSAARGHCYAGPGNQFWRLLHDSGLTPTRLTPEDDHTLPSYGIGLTGLAPGTT